MSYALLNVSPSQLEFLFEAERELKSTLNLRNMTDGVRVAFKIKTTNSERFLVCPPAGIVEPGTTRLVTIYLKAHGDYDDELRGCKDRFLVQSIVVDHTTEEKHLTSDLFRTGQRQEAKLKVVVAAPLAHSSVLENEIRTIAMRQGVEGHRAVVRKFSELLLARGVISQAQVVLAFSTVGEIFQGMQQAYKATTAEREKNFQQFLGRGGGAEGTHVQPKSDSETSSVPSLTFPRRGTADSIGFLATAGSTGLASRISDSGPAKIAEEEVSPPHAPTTPDADGPAKDGSAGDAEDSTGSGKWGCRNKRRGCHRGSGHSEHDRGDWHDRRGVRFRGLDAIKKFDEDALDALFTGNRVEEEKAEVPPSSLGTHKTHPPAAQRQLHFAAAAADPVNADVDTELAFGNGDTPPEKAGRMGRRHPRTWRTIGELIEANGNETSEKAEVGPDSSDEVESRDSPASPRRIALLTQVDPETSSRSSFEFDSAARGGTRHRLEHEHAKSQPTDGVGFVQGMQPSTISEIEPEPEIMPEAEEESQARVHDRSGRGWQREDAKDSFGRLNPVTSIDRLATPAIRKPALPAASKRIENAMSNSSNGQEAAASEDGMKHVLTAWRAPEEKQRAESPAESQSPQALEAQSSVKSVGSTGSGNLGVPIPSGNTMKMATFFGTPK